MSQKAQIIRSIIEDLKAEALKHVKDETTRISNLLKEAKLDGVGFIGLVGLVKYEKIDNIQSGISHIHTDGQNIRIGYSDNNAFYYSKIDVLTLDQVLGILERLELLENAGQVKIL